MNNELKEASFSSTSNSPHLDLIIKIYDEALDSFKKAKEYYRSENTVDGFRELERSKQILTQLYATLDSEKRAAIAKKLKGIYDYLLNQCNQAQSTKELKFIDDNISVLSNLREGWQYLKRQQKADNTDVANSENTRSDRNSNTSA